MAKCTVCGGDGKIPCSTCNGSGLGWEFSWKKKKIVNITCHNCKGKKTFKCYHCYGKGVEPEEEKTETCPICNGNKEIVVGNAKKGFKKQRCPTCRGSGKVKKK